jgi:hypothetical protein
MTMMLICPISVYTGRGVGARISDFFLSEKFYGF